MPPIFLFALLHCCSPTKYTSEDGNLPLINHQTFANHLHVDTVEVVNCHVRHISDGALRHLENLRYVNLSRNLIQRLTTRHFARPNKIEQLLVSHNLLHDLDAFDLEFFPKLRVLDVSYNRIKFIPEKIAMKVRQDEGFVLISHGNPLNESWRFDGKFELPDSFQLKAPPQASFVTCVFWILGAFWMGIIVGNVCLIKRLLCGKKTIAKKTQSTQFDSYGLHSCKDSKVYSQPSTGVVTSYNQGIYV